MNRFRYYLKIYGLLATQYIKARMAYRADFFISLVGILVMNIIGLLTLWLVFQSIHELAGWGYYELIFIYAFALLSMLPVQLFFENIWQLGGRLIDGGFIKYYFRPLDILFYFLSEKIDIKAVGQFVLGVWLLIYSSSKLGIDWGFLKAGMLLFLLASSSFVLAAITLAASALGFWVLNPTFALILVLKLRGFSNYPLNIYNTFFKYLFTFIIPIGYIAFYPAGLILRPSQIDPLAFLSPFVGIVLFYAAYIVWMKGALNYQGTGS
jgi:ABC-2 type transport system permease protein